MGTLGQRHFDVQLLGGMVLHEGDIAEMRTGEEQDAGRDAGGLSQRANPAKAFIVLTVNDYLARRDVRMDGPNLFGFLGMIAPASSSP